MIFEAAGGAENSFFVILLMRCGALVLKVGQEELIYAIKPQLPSEMFQ
jgi:hypothetical protein